MSDERVTITKVSIRTRWVGLPWWVRLHPRYRRAVKAVERSARWRAEQALGIDNTRNPQ